MTTAFDARTDDPHADQPVVRLDPPGGGSAGVVILIHGRSASPRSILELVPRLGRPDFTYLAPAASGKSWYPLSFLSDIAQNEPFLTSALRRIGAVLDEALAGGVPQHRIALMGFSQGACLAAEFVCRRGGRFGAVALFSGGLIGPPGTTWNARRSLAGTPIFLGCSDADAHVPRARVDESAQVFASAGASVTERIYPGMGHLVNDDEIQAAQQLLDQMR
jgi:predicted esterase